MSSIADESLAIAIVDDDPIFRELIAATVTKLSKFVIYEASSGDELVDLIGKERIDCIVLDYDLGNETGLSVKQRIDDTWAQPPPTIIMSGAGRESTAIRAFRIGVSDYLPKLGLRPRDLVASVLKAVRQDREEVLKKLEYSRLVEAYGVDAVTGMPGRSRLEDRLNRILLLPPRSRSAYALILIELVEYQAIAERFGLKTADQAVRAFSKTLQELSRANDVCGRFHGGTFLLIAEVGSSGETIEKICRRLIAKLGLHLHLEPAELTLSARIAGARCSVDTQFGLAGLDLVEPVVAALAQAKAMGLPFVTIDSAPPDGGVVMPQDESALAGSAAAVPGLDAHPVGEELRARNRRRVARQRVLKRGLIYTIDRTAMSTCTVRNISTDGAALHLEAPFPVPDVFDLEVVGSGEQRRVRVRWQVAGDLGVEFQKTP